MALLPALAFPGLPFMIMRMIRRVDERYRDEIRSSIVFSFLWTTVAAVGYGFLEGAGAPKQSMVWVWPVMMLFVVGHLGVRTAPRAMKNRIREMRDDRGWTQADLARELEISRQTVNALEAGRWDPSLPLAFSLARLFGLSIEELFDPAA